jgi:arylsulfatase A-like enzyme
MYVHVPLYPPLAFLERAQNGPYGAEVEHLDFTTGVILDTLRQLDIDEDTLVIFTSDNGASGRDGSSNAPLRGYKGQTWEGGMRLPCIARWPGKIAPGTVCRELSTSMDLLPTLAGLAGAETPKDRIIDGHDVLPLWLAEKGAASPYRAFFYYRENDLEAVRSGRWKLHVKSGQLYDLETDIGEQMNVCEDNPDVMQRLSQLADACRRDLGDAAQNVEGEGCRPVGQVASPTTLTTLDTSDPVVAAEYD